MSQAHSYLRLQKLKQITALLLVFSPLLNLLYSYWIFWQNTQLLPKLGFLPWLGRIETTSLLMLGLLACAGFCLLLAKNWPRYFALAVLSVVTAFNIYLYSSKNQGSIAELLLLCLSNLGVAAIIYTERWFEVKFAQMNLEQFRTSWRKPLQAWKKLTPLQRLGKPMAKMAQSVASNTQGLAHRVASGTQEFAQKVAANTQDLAHKVASNTAQMAQKISHNTAELGHAIKAAAENAKHAAQSPATNAADGKINTVHENEHPGDIRNVKVQGVFIHRKVHFKNIDRRGVIYFVTNESFWIRWTSESKGPIVPLLINIQLSPFLSLKCRRKQMMDDKEEFEFVNITPEQNQKLIRFLEQSRQRKGA